MIVPCYWMSHIAETRKGIKMSQKSTNDRADRQTSRYLVKQGCNMHFLLLLASLQTHQQGTHTCHIWMSPEMLLKCVVVS